MDGFVGIPNTRYWAQERPGSIPVLASPLKDRDNFSDDARSGEDDAYLANKNR